MLCKQQLSGLDPEVTDVSKTINHCNKKNLVNVLIVILFACILSSRIGFSNDSVSAVDKLISSLYDKHFRKEKSKKQAIFCIT